MELTAKPSEWQQRTCTQYLLSACKVNGNNERAVWKGTQLCSFQPHQDDGFRQLLEEVAHSIPFLWTINPIFTTLPSMKPKPGLFFREAGDKSHLSITTHGNNLFNSPALMCQTYVCCFFQVGYSVSHTKCFLLPTFFHHFIFHDFFFICTLTLFMFIYQGKKWAEPTNQLTTTAKTKSVFELSQGKMTDFYKKKCSYFLQVHS